MWHDAGPGGSCAGCSAWRTTRGFCLWAIAEGGVLMGPASLGLVLSVEAQPKMALILGAGTTV